MSINVVLDISEDDEKYLVTSARLRNTSKTELLRRVIDTVLHDQLILGVLDDEGKPTTRKVGRPRAETKKPADKLFRGLSVPVPKPWAASVARRKNASERTKAEMYADLRQAVENT